MPKLVITAVSLLLLTNVVVLAGVAYNRTGEPLITIELTERELPVQNSFRTIDENSGTALTLKWHVFDQSENLNYMYTAYRTPVWLDETKLTGLGFDMENIMSNIDWYQYRTSHLAIDVILVLEYNGETYRQALALQENKLDRLRTEAESNDDDENLADRYTKAKEQLAQMKESQSRLYVIDAGLDKQALIQEYKDDKYLLVPGKIGLRWSDDEVEGYIRQTSIEQVHVPLPFSRVIAEFDLEDGHSPYISESIPPRYSVKLNVGKRLEPWIDSVSITK